MLIAALEIVPGSENGVAIELLTTHIRKKLEDRSNRFRNKMAIPHLKLSPEEYKLEDLDLIVLPQTPQLKVPFTIL